MFFKDFVNGLSGPFRWQSIEGSSEPPLADFNRILPFVLNGVQCLPVPSQAVAPSIHLSAFPLGAHASAVKLRLGRTSLLLQSQPESLRLLGSAWFLFCMQAPATLHMDGRCQSLLPGDLLLLDTNCRCGLAPVEYLDCIVIALRQAGVAQSQSLLDSARGRCFSAESGWARLLSAQLRALSDEFLEKIAVTESDQIVCLEHVLSLLGMMLNQAVSWQAVANQDKGLAIRHKQYNDITLWLYQNFAEAGLTGQKVADQFHISVRTLHKLFGQFNASCSFAVFLNHIRMKNAKRMLWDSSMTHLTVADIGWQCGFSDPAHFGKVFKKYYRVTPKQMRENAPVSWTGRG